VAGSCEHDEETWNKMIQGGKFLGKLSDHHLLRRTFLRGVNYIS
jgi:hypothetical protein